MKFVKTLLLAVVFLTVLTTLSLSHPAVAPVDPAGSPSLMTPDEATPNDASLQAAIQEKLANAKSTQGQSIQVAVKEGVVTLTGKVETGRQKGAATRMAKAVAGVKSVENKLEVTNPTPISRSKSKKS
ncbi:MAG: BON domain-containing protein [Acidobacteriia bacterium]|nr:BON domain-containing protein [Terriglobia bacterium]